MVAWQNPPFTIKNPFSYGLTYLGYVLITKFSLKFEKKVNFCPNFGFKKKSILAKICRN